MAKPTSLYIDLEKRTEPMREYGIKGTDVYTSQASPHTLGNVAGFDDLKYATPDYNRYQDLYGLYLGGGFDDYVEGIDPSTGTVDTSVGTGEGGGTPPGTGGGSTPGTDYTGVNPFEDIDTGAGEFDNLGPTVPGATAPPGGGDPGMYYDATPDYSNVTNVGNPFGYGMQRTTKNPRAPGQDGATNVGTVNLTGADPGAGRIWPDRSTTSSSMPSNLGGSMDYMESALDAPYGINPTTGEPYQTPRSIADQNAVLGQTFTPEQQSTVQNIFGKVGNDVGLALTELGKLPGAIVDSFNKTVDVFGRKIDVGKTVGGMLLNKFVGGPATLGIEFLKRVLPEDNIKYTTNKAREVGLLTGDTTTTQDKYGINTQSHFGDYNQYNVDQVEKLETRLDELKTGKYKDDLQGYLDNTKRMRTELEERKDYVKSSGADGDIDERDQMLEDISLQNKIDTGIQAADDDSGSEMLVDTPPVTGIEGPPSQISGPQVTAPDGTLASDKWNNLDTTEVDIPDNYFDTSVTTGAIPPGEKGGPGYIEPSKTLATDRWNTGAFDYGYDDSIMDMVSSDELPTGELTKEQYDQALAGIDTDGVFLDEKLGYVDAAGNPIDDPNAIGNIQGAGLENLSTLDKVEFNKLDIKDKLNQSGVGPPLTTEEQQKLKELREKREFKIKPISLNTIDTSDDKPIDTGPVTTGSGNNPFGYTDPSPPTGTDRPGGDREPPSAPPSAPVSTAGQAGPPSQRGGGADRDPAPSAPSTPDYSNVRTGGPPSRGGGGGGPPSQGGKIVCTMMNESYGFGSFRNKIWIKYARDHLSPEYQKGYHKIFLPLVKYAKQDGTTNRIVKKVLEHIAVHRTIDIRQEARGKVHLLGRIYRKILEPICYIVGKYAKR